MLISQYLILYGLLLTAVVVHELGHYVIARLLGIQILGVYIFWSLGFHVFSTHDAWFVKLFPTFAKKHEICIGWIPLFAYVKFERLSDIDDCKPSLLHNQSPLSQLLVFAFGVLTNYVFAFILCFGILHTKHISMPLSQVSKNAIELTNVGIASTVESISRDIRQIISPSSDKPKNVSTAYQGVHPQENVASRMARRMQGNKYGSRIALYLMWINIGLVVFNCIPVPPLDGWHILRCISLILIQLFKRCFTGCCT